MACRLPYRIWMRRLSGNATIKRIFSKGGITGVTTRIATVLTAITQDQFQFGVRNKVTQKLYISLSLI